MNKKIFLIGIGNYTEVIIELAQDCGFIVEGLYHYNNEKLGQIVNGIEVIGQTSDLFEKDITKLNFAITIGDNKKRGSLANKIRKNGGITPNLIHPKSSISPSAKIGVGCFLHNASFIWTKSTIGNDCILSPNAHISHHVIIGNECFITSFSIVGAYCVLESNIFLGLNSTILPKLKVGSNTFIGAKANLIKNCSGNTTLIGNPATTLTKKL